MTLNAKMTRSLGGSSQEVLFAADDELNPSVANTVVVRAQLVGTRQRIELAARCPKCHRLHRHIKPGKKTAPCGQRYTVVLRRRSA